MADRVRNITNYGRNAGATSTPAYVQQTLGDLSDFKPTMKAGTDAGTASLQSARTENLISDPKFDSSIGNWTPTNGTLSILDGVSHSGTRSLLLTSSNINGASAEYGVLGSAPFAAVPVKPGETYRVGGWMAMRLNGAFGPYRFKIKITLATPAGAFVLERDAFVSSAGIDEFVRVEEAVTVPTEFNEYYMKVSFAITVPTLEWGEEASSPDANGAQVAISDVEIAHVTAATQAWETKLSGRIGRWMGQGAFIIGTTSHVSEALPAHITPKVYGVTPYLGLEIQAPSKAGTTVGSLSLISESAAGSGRAVFNGLQVQPDNGIVGLGINGANLSDTSGGVIGVYSDWGTSTIMSFPSARQVQILAWVAGEFISSVAGAILAMLRIGISLDNGTTYTFGKPLTARVGTLAHAAVAIDATAMHAVGGSATTVIVKAQVQQGDGTVGDVTFAQGALYGLCIPTLLAT